MNKLLMILPSFLLSIGFLTATVSVMLRFPYVVLPIIIIITLARMTAIVYDMLDTLFWR